MLTQLEAQKAKGGDEFLKEMKEKILSLYQKKEKYMAEIETLEQEKSTIKESFIKLNYSPYERIYVPSPKNYSVTKDPEHQYWKYPEPTQEVKELLSREKIIDNRLSFLKDRNYELNQELKIIEGLISSTKTSESENKPAPPSH